MGQAVPQEAADLGSGHLAEDGSCKLAALEGSQPGRELGLSCMYLRRCVVVQRHADAQVLDCVAGQHWRQGRPLAGAKVGDEHLGLLWAVGAEARFGCAVVGLGGVTVDAIVVEEG